MFNLEEIRYNTTFVGYSKIILFSKNTKHDPILGFYSFFTYTYFTSIIYVFILFNFIVLFVKKLMKYNDDNSSY